MFTQVQNAYVLLNSRGVYRFAPILTLEGELYAGYSAAGSIKLRADHRTSKDRVTWVRIIGTEFKAGKLAALVLP